MNILRTIPEKREHFEKLVGFDFIRERLEPKTPYGRKYFKHLQPFGYEHLRQHLDDVEFFVRLVRGNEAFVREIEAELECVLDVSLTVEKLKGGQTIDEIEMFQLKNFLIVVESIRERVATLVPDRFSPPDLTPALNLLDPEGLRATTFHVYDAYDDRLREVRKRKLQLLKAGTESEREIVELTIKERELEDEVLSKLSFTLSKYAGQIEESIEKVKLLDVLITKARLATELGLSKPHVVPEPDSSSRSGRAVVLSKMFNPALKNVVERAGGAYQPIDVVVEPGVTVIVGANMTGKSVTLRTVALVTYMTHLGFFVPCECCELPLFELVAIVAEDSSKPLSGLSSFAAEIATLDEVLKRLRNEVRTALILIDEPARTTNPHEGVAIVNALCVLLERPSVYTLIVTHFDEVRSRRKLKVKGLKRELLEGKKFSATTETIVSEIQKYIDYELIELSNESEAKVPKEAILVMELMRVNPELIDEAKRWLESRLCE